MNGNSVAATAAPQVKTALLILRIGLGLFLLVWGLEKFILPDRTVGIFGKFYGIDIGAGMTPLLGGLECVLAVALLIGWQRRWSYGIAVLVHAVSTIASWRQIIDPWGLISGTVHHLFFAAVPVLAAFIALYLLRDYDAWTVDGSRAGTAPVSGGAGTRAGP